MRTSHTHPLQIAAITPQPGFGTIGITFCPGKKQPHAMSGGWDRDLGLDLDVIADFGAAAVVTLIEPHEMRALGVEDLGSEVAARHMDWLHLPIPDVSVPDAGFEATWRVHGPGLRARLRHGFNILVHCKGGLGRAGTIAVRLLVELGWPADEAIAAVRAVRPGAIETPAQEAHVRQQARVEESAPCQSDAAIRDRAIGALLGLAVGDAVGTTLEFKPRGSYPRLTDMIGGGPFGLKPGQWTDDTAMALALADSLYVAAEFDPEDLMRRFVDWRDEGTYSCTETCFDIGITTNDALNRWQRSGDPYAGATDPNTAGNGSLMRLAPVAIRFWRDPEALRRVAALQSRTTHGAPEAVSACVAYAELLAKAIAGVPAHEVLSPRSGDYAGAIAAIMAGSWRGKARREIASSGYVAHSLEAALWSVARTSDFRSAILLAANLGGDADTTAAIAGQLAGALYGASGIPQEWLGMLAWKPRIEGMAHSLIERAGPLAG
ncbi:ADP-ribosylglycohydrolase family protein [Erythrobacter cryptus]|uniref:ADP-ribosylglycohydrolase family protein n=1 Tax=Erythrobacter cryptus TaxID=196588 RepID=UPI0004142BE2|nr:ADP-ribosylglycohydrolase family protein [Erythrobacter cryptus]